MARKKGLAKFWHTKLFILHVAVYKVQVIVCINMTGDEILKRVSKIASASAVKEIIEIASDQNKKDKITQGTMYQLQGGFLVTIRADKNSFRDTVGILVHEMTHVTHYLLRDRRIPLSEDTEEAHTYLVEYLVTQSLKLMY